MVERHDSELRALLFQHKHRVEREKTESENRLYDLKSHPSNGPPAKLHHLKFPKQYHQLRAKYSNTLAQRRHFSFNPAHGKSHSVCGNHLPIGWGPSMSERKEEAEHQHLSVCPASRCHVFSSLTPLLPCSPQHDSLYPLVSPKPE